MRYLPDLAPSISPGRGAGQKTRGWRLNGPTPCRHSIARRQGLCIVSLKSEIGLGYQESITATVPMRTGPGTAQRYQPAANSKRHGPTPRHISLPYCPQGEEDQHGKIDHDRRDHPWRIAPEDNGGGDVWHEDINQHGDDVPETTDTPKRLDDR